MGHHLSQSPLAVGFPCNRPATKDEPSRCCLILLLTRFTVPARLPGPRWALTPPFHPYLDIALRASPGACLAANVQSLFPYDTIQAVSFLWPCLSPCGARGLPGVMLSGARTFLRRKSDGDGPACLPYSLSYHSSSS